MSSTDTLTTRVFAGIDIDHLDGVRFLCGQEDSISRTNSLFGTGCRTEIVIGMAFADRLLSFINTLPVSCSYCIKIASILELIAWKELRASSAVDGFVAGVPAGCWPLATERLIIQASNRTERRREYMSLLPSPSYHLLPLCTPVADPQGLQHFAVDNPGNRQSLCRLEPANRFAAARANHPVNSAMVIAAPCKFRLD